MTHKGGCHCGKVAFEFEGEIGSVLDCNCSFCQKRGALLHFIPAASFTLETPREDLGTYTFNTHKLAHHFCPNCGISPFSEGADPKATGWWRSMPAASKSWTHAPSTSNSTTGAASNCARPSTG